MNIINLQEEPQQIGQLVEWHHNEWSYLNPDGSIEERTERMKRYLEPDFVPSTFIGKDNDALIGSVAVVKHDMDTHEELSPWLASVYVSAGHRKHGYGGLLVRQRACFLSGIEGNRLFDPADGGDHKMETYQAEGHREDNVELPGG